MERDSGEIMARYITKQAEIEAVQWNGENIEEIDYSAGSNIVYISIPKGLLKVRTAEGIITAVTGDYIIKDSSDKFYLCKSKIFEEKYILIQQIT